MAGYGSYDIQQVDVTKSLALGEQVRQNRMMEELKNYQIAKAKREDEAEVQVGRYLPGVLKGATATKLSPADQAAYDDAIQQLARVSPTWALKVASLKTQAQQNELINRLREAQILRTEKLTAGGGVGVAGAPVFGPPVAAPGVAPTGPRPGIAPVAPMGGAPRPFGYSLPGQQSALPGADTTGADVPSPVPVEPAAPALPPGRFQGIGAVPTLDPAIAPPEGESGNEPPTPAAPVVPTQAPGPAPDRSARNFITADDAVYSGEWREFIPGDKRQSDVAKQYMEKGHVLLRSKDGTRVKPFPMVAPVVPATGEVWGPDPKDPRYQINARTNKKELIAVPATDKADQPSQVEVGKVRTMQAEARTLIAALDQYRDLIGSAKWDERLGAVVGVGTGGAKLNTAYNSAALLAKGEELFNLGVLNGPDLAIIRRTITDPSEWFKMGQKNEAIQAQVDMVKNLVATRLAEREKAVGMKPADVGAKPMTSARPTSGDDSRGTAGSNDLRKKYGLE